jgi:hypothetical protein
VLPGSISTLSIPRKRRIGKRRSINCDAKISVPNDGFGATFFTANPGPK